MAVEEVGIRLSLQQRRQTTAGLREVKGELAGVADAGQDVEAGGKAAARGLEVATDRRFVRGLEAITRGGGGLVKTLGSGILGATRIAAAGLGIVTAAATTAGVASIGLAGDARETASAFETVFGPSARGVQKDLDGLTRRFGLYNPELQDSARQFGVFGKAAGIARKDLPGFSTDLTKAGLDLSSFYNVDPGTVFDALQSGLSGEAEPLRQFGIFISDATMKAKAASMGLTGTLTEQQKVMVRQRLIMGSLGDAQGDLARTSKGFANQQRAAGGQTKTFLTMLGGPLTTAATGAFKGFNAIATSGIRLLKDELPGLEQKAGGVSKFLGRWGRQLAHDLPNGISIALSWWDRWSGKLDGVKSQAGGLNLAGIKGQLGGIRAPLRDIGDALKGVDFSALGSGVMQGASDTLSVFSVVIGFAADHVDTLAKYMPWLIAGLVAYKTAQATANVLAIADIPLKAAQLVANIALARSNSSLATQMALANGVERVGMMQRARGTVVMIAQKAAMLAGAAATGVLTAAQWLWNAALTANPIGIVIVAVAALAAGIYLLWKKSDTFRAGVLFVWNSVLKPFGKWIGGILVGYFKLLGNAYLSMARFGIRAFTWLLKAAFKTFDGILAAAEKGLGWVPGLGDKIRTARAKFDEFGNATIGKLQQLDAKLKATQDKINGIARDRSATITITTNTGAGLAEASLNGGAGKGGGGGTSPTTGGGSGGPRRRSLTLSAPLVAPPVDVADLTSAAAADYAIAGAAAGPGQPLVIQNVMDGKVVGEKTVGYIQGRLARK